MSICRRFLQLSANCQFIVALSTFTVFSMPGSFVQAQAPFCQDLFISDEVIIEKLKVLAELNLKITLGEYNHDRDARTYAELSFRKQLTDIVKLIGSDRFKELNSKAQVKVQKSELQEIQEKRNEKEAKINTPKLHSDNLLKIKVDEMFSENIVKYFEQMAADYRPLVSEDVIREWSFEPDKSVKAEFSIKYRVLISQLVNGSFDNFKKSVDLNMYGTDLNQATFIAYNHRNENAFNYMLKLPGIDLGRLFRNDYTVWHLATLSNWTESIEILVQLSPDNMNKKDSLGWTPLDYSIDKQRKDIFHLFIQQPQIDVQTYKFRNDSVLNWAIHHGWKDSFDYLVNQRGIIPDPVVVEKAKAKGWIK